MSRSFTVLRVGDQVFFRNGDSNEWYTEGYYRLAAIASVFGGRMKRFAAFGRILTVPPEGHENYYRVPTETAPDFSVTGVYVRAKGLRHYLGAFVQLISKLRKVTATNDIQWFIMPTLAGLVGLLVAPQRGVRVAQFVGEWAKPMQMKYPMLAPLAVPLLEKLSRAALNRADIAVFVSNHLQQKYGRHLKREVIVANESRLRPWMITEMDRSEIHRPLRVLYAGRLVPEKGIEVLIEAIAQVSRHTPCELWIVGQGPSESSLRQRARNRNVEGLIRWFGWVSWGEDLFRIMREADVLVLPSFTEGLPLVVVEAMSQSLPVVASATGGVPEIVRHGETGLLFRPGNSEELAKCIMDIATDSNLRSALVANGLRMARQNTFEATTGRVIEMMCELAQRKGL